ncbi:spidroin-1-like [Paralichthys olivaceus]|uniref:spidroin-1-like n=1 Tax=Paralichthys olivaceus TaxID=8255 RepID=UPI0037523721
MKIPRPGYNEGAGASGSKTKGYGAGAGVPSTYGAKPNGYGAGAGAGGFSNGGGTKANKPGYGAGSYPVPGLSNGHGAGFRFPYAGNPKQPGYGHGAYPGAGYGNGNSYGGYGNGYSAGVQPDFASLGQGFPTADAKSGGAAQVPYNGAPVVPDGLDGISQPAGLGPNGKLGSMYGGMGGLPFGGQKHGMGAAKSNAKYGIGGLQFGGQPLGTGQYGYGGGPYGHTGDGKSAGNYGGLGAGMGGEPAPGQYGHTGFPNAGQLLGLGSNGNIAGKYGYGRMPYEAQPAGLSPEVKSTGQYGFPASPYQPEHLGLGHNAKLSSPYGGGEVPYTPQALGFGGEAKSAGKYGNQGAYHSQPLESASEGRSVGDYEAAGLPYESLPSEPDSPGKSYVKGELQTPVAAVESEGMSYDNVGYINGHVQPEAPTAGPDLAYPSVPSHLPEEASFAPDVAPGAGVEDLPESAGAADPVLDSAAATETHGVMEGPEQSEDLLQEQLPRQIHIQQHFKLHFHQQGAKDRKYDLNGFFGNSGFQG